MFGAAKSLNAFMRAITCKHGDVLVLTSWWRRFRGTEKWAIAVRVDGSGECVFVDASGRIAKGVGRMVLCNDPDKWPDDVCAAVVMWRLTE